MTVKVESAISFPVRPQKKSDFRPVRSISHIAMKMAGILGKYTISVANNEAACLTSSSDIQSIDSKGLLNRSDTPAASNMVGVKYTTYIKENRFVKTYTYFRSPLLFSF